MFFYKYCQDEEYTCDSIRDRTIHFSKITDFNDPFDCLFKLEFEGSNRQLVNFFKKRNSRYPESKERLISTIKKSEKNFLKENPLFTGQLLQYMSQEQIQNSYIVSCFSESFDNRLMWSHYSKNHTGLVIGYSTKSFNEKNYFEIHDQEQGSFDRYLDKKYLPLFKVKYRNELALINPLNPKYNDYINDVFCRKDEIWSYEREWRVFLHYEKEQFNYKLSQKMDLSIYLGAKMDKKKIDKYKKLVDSMNNERESEISLYRMKIDRDSYKLIPIKI